MLNLIGGKHLPPVVRPSALTRLVDFLFLATLLNMFILGLVAGADGFALLPVEKNNRIAKL